MAITRHSSFDTTVQSIADRNSIENKVDHMVVLVKDAIADVDAGPGKATYRYDASDSSWILVSKSNFSTMSFDTEEIQISNGSVTLSNIPKDGKIWNISVISGDVILAEMRLEDLTISNAVVSGIPSNFDGNTFRCTYGYGSIAQQLNSVIDNMGAGQTAEEILLELPEA